MESAAPDGPDGVVPYLALRHVEQVLAMHQAKARLRQAILRPDLAAALAGDALGILEDATAPARRPRLPTGQGREAKTPRPPGYWSEAKRRQRARRAEQE